ncbi:hypothetical protein [Enterobacter asburiae]|uniref:hypothetical protein n=1 Tax=Enterobacter asburiae TaxID=61645 RepID=UPI003BDAFDC8
MSSDKNYYYLNTTGFGIIGDDSERLLLGFGIPVSESPFPVNEIFFRIDKGMAQEIVEMLQIHLEKMGGAISH